MKKLFAMLLAVVMVFGLVACAPAAKPAGTTAAPVPGTTAPNNNGPVVYEDPYKDITDYDELSMAIYEDVLGEFYNVYAAAKAATNVSKRQALMAVAEAKLLASGVMLPLTSNGGNYAISRVVPYTATSTLWGNDSYRYHNVLVVTGKILTAADRDTLKALWAEKKGTGTWEADAKAWLAENGYTLTDKYTIGYSSDPQTWDVLGTSMAADSEAIVNTYDGLFEYDSENRLMPALAKDYTVSADGLVYTFHIRENVKWVDSQGREVGEVTADDFVAGLQHMMDVAEGLEYLAGESGANIVNADAYIAGDVADFAEVGVKAVDKYTLQYTLAKPTSFFMTMLGYGVFAPMNRAFYEAQGGKFGADFDSSAETYLYGTSPDKIAYCGPYLVTNWTKENTIVFQANPSYWNAENINIKTLTWLFNDGEDQLKAYNDMKAEVISGCGLNASALEAAKADNLFDTYAYVSSCDATTFMAFVNLRRVAMSNFNDGAVPSSKTEEQVARSNAAMLNQNFRLALATAVDRGNYNAQTVGEALKLTSLRNSYTPGTFITLAEEVTIKIGGADKTYPAGTAYGQIMQDQLDADGIKIKAWDPTAEGGIGSTDGFDGWYNADNAKAYMQAAIAELKAQGIEISKENPIYLDLPTFTGSEAYKNRSNAYKQSVEAATDGCIIINLTECQSSKEWYYAGYYPTTGAEGNFDICDMSGWGPDYGDPQSYLDTMLPAYAGYMTKAIGLF